MTQRRLSVAGVLVFFVVSISAPAKTVSDQSSMTLLKQADMLSRTFSPEERADILFDLANAAVPLDPSLAASWASELWRISTKELVPGHYRAAMQKDALITLARVNPQKAAGLYTSQDLPNTWTKGQIVGEDIRADGCRQLFSALWRQKHMAAVGQIRSVASAMGSTGQYPYEAMTEIVKQVGSRNRILANSLYAEAISYLPNGQSYVSTNQQFVNFILNTRAVVDKRLQLGALQAAVDALEKNEKAPKTAVEVTTPKGKAAFHSLAEFLIYKLLPTIRDLDPEWASQLTQKYSNLRLAPNLSSPNGMIVSGAVSFGTDPPSQEDVRNALDESRLQKVSQLAGQNPKQAAELAMEIQDNQLRAVALATVAPSYRSINPQTAELWMSEPVKRLEAMDLSRDKLRLAVALCKSYFSEKRMPDAIAMMQKAFDFGEDLFSEYERKSPGTMVYAVEGFEELSDLVDVSVRQLPLPDVALTRIKMFRNDVLRARMLVVAANALQVRMKGEPLS